MFGVKIKIQRIKVFLKGLFINDKR
jgi:hypothetical protein